MRGLGDVRQSKQPGRVRLGGGVDETIVRRQVIYVGEVGDRHRKQVAVAEHRSFRTAGGAAGVENPGEIVRATIGDRACVGGGQLPPFLFAGHNETRRARKEIGERTRNIGAGKAKARSAVGGDIGEFAGMELGVRRNRNEPGAPDGKENCEIFGVVGHRQRDTVAGLHAESVAHGRCKPRRHLPIGGVGVKASITDRNRRLSGNASRGVGEEVREIHGRSLRTSSLALENSDRERSFFDAA